MTLAARTQADLPRDLPTDSWGRRWLPFALVTVMFAAAASYEIELPGVYSDEVNPDYNAVRVLNWNHPPITPDALPGNALFGRLPILTGLQHGTQTLWLGIPAFWLFGTTVTGLRITHALFALAIVAGVYALLCAAGIRRWLAAGVCAALAIDPAFIYSFRTQGYLSLAPAAWMFIALYALQRAANAASMFVAPQRPANAVKDQRRWLALSGLTMGLAFSGYFIYLFYAPVVALAVALWPDPGATRAQRVRGLAWWTAWFFIGTLPYVIGYSLLVLSQESIAAGVAYIMNEQAQLGGKAQNFSLQDRFAFFWLLVRLVFSNGSHHWLIFGEPAYVVGADVKTALLIGLPPLLWLVAEYRRRATPMLRILLAMQVCFSAWALYFGGRLWAHHYEPLIPIAYAALALAFATLLPAPAGRLSAKWPQWPQWLGAAPFAVLLGLNAAGVVEEADALRESGGAGLYSDAINRFADDVLRDHRNDYVSMPDWGLFTSAVFLTGGTVEMDTYESFAHARNVLCAGRNVTVALITGDRAARFANWQSQLAWTPPAVRQYRQRSGTVVFEVGTFNAGDAGERCAAPAGTRPAAQ